MPVHSGPSMSRIAMPMQVIDLTGSPPPNPVISQGRKRKAADLDLDKHSVSASPSKSGGEDVQYVESVNLQGPEDSPPKKKSRDSENAGERRLRRERKQCPQGAAYQQVYHRAMWQRMFCLDRVRGGNEECPEETMRIAGSTGNVYTIHVGQLPTCDCPHAVKGHECKHIIFALKRVLKASDGLFYQRAFLRSELREIFANAPAIVPVNANETTNERKPIEEDDNCPICFMEFTDGYKGTVYCKTACGNNIHKQCFEQWAASRRRSAAPVTCPFCRSNWESDGKLISSDLSRRAPTHEGYVNVAADLGINTQRDYSSYNDYWVRQQRRDGVSIGDWHDLR